MATPPPPPQGYIEARAEEPRIPGVEVGMLAVFTGIGWLLQRQHPLGDIPMVRFLILAAVVTILTEVAHEGFHVLAFAVQGVDSTVFWGTLSVVPTDQFVEKRTLMIATLTPITLLNGCFLVVYLFVGSGILAILAGFAIAINSSLSVLDLTVFVMQLNSPAETLYRFDIESGEIATIWAFEPETG